SPRQVTGHVSNPPRPWRHGGGKAKDRRPRATLGSGKREDGAMTTSDDVQKRNAFAACAAFRIEGLEASLDQAREIAVRDELGAVGHYIAESAGYPAQIRLLPQGALGGFSRAAGELGARPRGLPLKPPPRQRSSGGSKPLPRIVGLKARSASRVVRH